ncbi:gp30 domain protein [Burkholderia pseudomallei A79D]|nr:gp30 domain protein [Burkholderia pseudomallei A79D]KGX95438.1 gp30 domain protein [Burkholderia pseudomallei A79C]
MKNGDGIGDKVAKRRIQYDIRGWRTNWLVATPRIHARGRQNAGSDEQALRALRQPIPIHRQLGFQHAHTANTVDHRSADQRQPVNGLDVVHQASDLGCKRIAHVEARSESIRHEIFAALVLFARRRRQIHRVTGVSMNRVETPREFRKQPRQKIRIGLDDRYGQRERQHVEPSRPQRRLPLLETERVESVHARFARAVSTGERERERLIFAQARCQRCQRGSLGDRYRAFPLQKKPAQSAACHLFVLVETR